LHHHGHDVPAPLTMSTPASTQNEFSEHVHKNAKIPRDLTFVMVNSFAHFRPLPLDAKCRSPIQHPLSRWAVVWEVRSMGDHTED